MAAIIVILAIVMTGAQAKLGGKPCDAKTECQHPAFK